MRLAASISIDTGVLVEYIDSDGMFHSEAKALVESVTSGRLSGLVTHVVFAELFYVATRLYEQIEEKENAEAKSERLVRWLFNSPNIVMPENTLELALRAGRFKKRFALALPDSYVLACAQLNGCKAIFKSAEAETERGNKLERLRKEEKVELIFLEDYSSQANHSRHLSR